MVRLFFDARMLNHLPTPPHVEMPIRLQAIEARLRRAGFFETCPRGKIRPATDEELRLVHDPRHLKRLQEAEDGMGDRVDPDTWVNPGSLEAARLAVGAGLEAVNSVLNGQVPTALALVRPPGHHALVNRAMGFCLFANVSIAAKAALGCGLERILIVDWDVHHGNGTQDIFYDDPRVAFFSMHRYPFWPGTGHEDETGVGAGLGFNKNLPVAYGSRRNDIRSSFAAELETFADTVRPELILISAGFDAHAQDPIGSLGLETEDFVELTKIVRRIADTHAQGRMISFLEGGYNPHALAESVEAHLIALGADLPFSHRGEIH